MTTAQGNEQKRQYLYEFVFGHNVLLKNQRFLSGVNTPPAKVKETSID